MAAFEESSEEGANLVCDQVGDRSLQKFDVDSTGRKTIQSGAFFDPKSKTVGELFRSENSCGIEQCQGFKIVCP